MVVYVRLHHLPTLTIYIYIYMSQGGMDLMEMCNRSHGVQIL